MIGRILIFVLTVTIASSLEPKKEDPGEEIKKILAKYIDKIPDLPPRYVINSGLTKLISNYYKSKIKTFPLYKISLKIDRKPVKIPWTLGAPDNFNETKSGKKYTYVRVQKPDGPKKSKISNENIDSPERPSSN